MIEDYDGRMAHVALYAVNPFWKGIEISLDAIESFVHPLFA